MFFEVDCPIVGEHFFLLLFGSPLDEGELLLHVLDMVAIGKQELSLVLLDYLLDLHVHLVDSLRELVVHLVGVHQGRNILARRRPFLTAEIHRC